MLPIQAYDTLIFDCDGVILNSNVVKTNAFFKVAEKFSTGSGEALRSFHVKNGGISRYQKFKVYLDCIVPECDQPADYEQGLKELLSMYSRMLKYELLKCEVAEGLEPLKQSSDHSNWLVISGSDQEELRSLFEKKMLSHFFKMGIYGSPRSKLEIVADLTFNGVLKGDRTLFLGDNRADYDAAISAGADFCFVHGWTEMPNWKAFVAEYEIPVIESLVELIA